MPYCHHCGTKSSAEDTFCGRCGKNLKAIVDDVKKEVVYIEKQVTKKSHKGFVFLIIFLIIPGYHTHQVVIRLKFHRLL